MTAVLLDTTVASLLHPNRKKDLSRRFFEPHLQNRIWAISFQTYAELWQWAEERKWGQKRRTDLHAFIQNFAVLPFSLELGQTWARVMTEARLLGRRLEAGDAWIASTAVLYGVPLLTTDTDFVDLSISGLEVISPAS